MRHLLLSLPVFLMVLITACVGDNTKQGSAPVETDSTEGVGSRGLTAETPAPPPCAVGGEILEGNWFYLREKDLMLAITADSTTLDEQYGPGHRVLLLYDTRSCTQLERHVLPVNKSPDFAYQIAEITYNNQSQLVGIKAFNFIYVYDVANRKLLPRLDPKFRTQRLGVDAQSGMIQRLEVWEDYLVGYAQDYGAFVFNMGNKNNPQAVLPFAEYQTPEEEFSSLFLLASGNQHQALLPVFLRETEDFRVNPLFSTPQPIRPDLSETAVGGRYAILRTAASDQPPVVVDLGRRERVSLPADIASAPAARLEDWLKKR